jgi:hypothetical protein
MVAAVDVMEGTIGDSGRFERIATDMKHLPARRGKSRGRDDSTRSHVLEESPSRNRPFPLDRSRAHPHSGKAQS